MDKYEYKLRSEEIGRLMEGEKYAEAVMVADTIDWRRVKSITMLLRVAALYRVNRRNEDCRAVLQLAYERYPSNRSVVYSLCEVSIELDDVVAAIEYYKEYVKLAPRDNGVYILRYRILEAQEASLEERIELLEEFKKRDYQEEWAYELAYLYHRVGLATKCVEECDDLILWFGDGAYVIKAMELKMLHAPLTPAQQKKYDAAHNQEAVESQEEETPMQPDEKAVAEAEAESVPQTDEPKETFIPETGSIDMSQYNTINLQKVVADSMRELFADDEDIFAEEYEELEEVTAGETRVASEAVLQSVQEAEQPESQPEAEAISEAATDNEVQDAQVQEQPAQLQEQPAVATVEDVGYAPAGEPEYFRPMTGQMNLNDVLAEWERIKQEDAVKQEEKVRQNVLRQTGKIFENFDQSIKSGPLGALEAAEAGGEYLTEAEQTEASSSEGASAENTSEENISVENTSAEDTSMEISSMEEDEVEELIEIEDTAETAEAAEEEQPEEEAAAAEAETDEEQPTAAPDMNTAEISSLPDKIIEATDKETKGTKKEELREFSPEEQALFENFAVTKKIRRQIIYALDKMSLASYTGNVLITGDAALGTVRLAKNLIREFQAMDANFSGKVAKITGEKLNLRNLKEVFDKLTNGAIIIEKANGLTQDKLYEIAGLLNQENLGIIVIMEDTRKEMTRLLEKQAMIADYFNIRIDLMEMDNNALVAYAKNYALALEYSIDEMGTLALYTRIANSQRGNHVVTKDEVRDIVDEAIWRSKRFNIKNFVDVLFAKRYDRDDMIVLRERDFM